ncbi:MAG: T9SS type A sorting domain-containing protein [Bacteroidales bacterium]
MVASDLVITLTNIQGQVIYQNKVAGTIDHQETIDNKLAKGLYFLSVNNGKEVKVQKIVVQ